MTAHRTLATAARMLRQLRHDHRTLALMFGLPTVLLGLLALMLVDSPGTFDLWGPPILGIFPLIIMFIVTSVATLRERTSGTLERLMAMPLGRGDLLAGYVLAFGLIGTVQAAIVSAFAFWVYGMEIPGSPLLLALVAVLDAILGTSMGLAASSVARTEFQAVQMMPALIFPQLFLSGLLVPREQLPAVLEWPSWLMPMSYTVDAANAAVRSPELTTDFVAAVAMTMVFVAASLLIGGLTLRRATR